MMRCTPDAYNMRRNRHPQVKMVWQGKKIKVDAGMVPLLTLFNRLPGIATQASCIDNKGLGYLLFTGDTKIGVKRVVEHIKALLGGKFSHLKSLSFEIAIESQNDGRACIRWAAHDLPIVKDLTKILLENSFKK